MSNGMKQSQNPRRTRGHRGGRRPNQQGRNTNFDSNGPEGRIRGNASQVIEKYQALGRDALLAGDRIAAENFFQHAEHYFRVMNANGGEAKPKQANGAQRGNNQDEADAGNGANNDSNDNRPVTRPSESAVESKNKSAETAEDTAPEVTSSTDATVDAPKVVNAPKVSSGVSAAPSDEGLMRALGEDDDQASV